MGAAGFTLACIHVFVWIKQKDQAAHLGFAVAAFSVAVIAVLEGTALQAQSVREFAAALRWAHLPVAFLFVGVVAFVQTHFQAGRLRLGAAACLLWAISLVPNFLSGVDLNFREITALQPVHLWGGVAVVSPVGVANPWMLLGQIAVLLLLAYLIDAALTLGRQGVPLERRRALRVCGSMAVFVFLASVWNALVFAGLIPAPVMFVPAFMAMLLVMSYELGGDILRAAQLSRSLAGSESSRQLSELRMDLAARAAGIGFWNWDIARGESWFSEPGLRLLGFAPGERFERKRFMERVVAADHEGVNQAFQAARRGDGDYNCEYRIRKPDGHTRWLATRGRLEFDGRTPARLHGVVVDITERRQAEERFRLVVEAAPTAMLLVEADGRIVFANEQTVRVFGYAREELCAMNVDALVPLAYPRGPAPVRTGAPDTPDVAAGRELFGQRKDGSQVPVEIGLNPIESDGGLQILVSITDISERKRMERESAVQRDELAHLSRVALLAELSGSLAHELNQPLTAILSNAQAAARFLAHDPPNLAEVRDSLGTIVECDKRAGEVIRRLRAMLRKEPAEFRHLEINEVVQDVLRIIRSDLLHRNVEVRLELAPNLPLIDGDRVQLQQVLLNLIMNGSEAMAELGGGRRLTVRALAGPDDGVEVQVCDAGRGIAADDLERIFSPFVTSKPGGMGLGLAVCTTIVLAHHGRLWASNNPAGGATLHFELPGCAERAP